MNNNSLAYINFLRNIGIIAHIDSGKTTVTERILFLCKQIYKIGEVHEGTAQTDYMVQERERGITIMSAAVTVNWERSLNSLSSSYKMNIIDTPGHLDFTAEVERCLRVLDGAVVIMDGKKGVEAQTETVWKQSNKYKVPRIIFINKLDSVEDESKFLDCIKSIRNKLQANYLVTQLPIGAGKDFNGIVDLIEQKAYKFVSGERTENYQEIELPEYLKPKIVKFRSQLIDSLLEFDEQLAFKFLEGEEINKEEIRRLIRKATLSGRFFPIICGSAYKHIGVKFLLNAVVDFLPSPADVLPASLCLKNPTEDEQNERKTILFSDNIPYLALAFKVLIDEFNNKIVFIRVYSGKIKNNSYIFNSSKEKEERVSTLVKMHANKEIRVNEVVAGDIAAIKNLKYTVTGDTFITNDNKDKIYILDAITFDKPVISQAIIPNTKEDNEKLGEVLEKIRVQDPSFDFSVDSETHQIVIKGMGELHLEIIVDRLRREYGLKLNTESPKVSYRETIKNTIETWAEYKKQSGGHGHFARILLKFEPNKGKGFEFLNKIRGESVPKKFAESVSRGLEEVLSSGLLLGYPVVDVKATLLDGKTHPVDSSDADFKEAAILACRKNKSELGLVLLEPIMQIVVSIPRDYMGDILANLGSRRTSIENTTETDGEVIIEGKAPLKEMINYSISLRRLTKGRGSYSMHLAYYSEVPTEQVEKMLDKK